MNFTNHLCKAGLLASMACALGLGTASAADKANADAFPNFESYIKVTGQAPSVSGKDSSYARRFQSPANGTYGIEDLRILKDGANDTAWQINGRALTGAEDYLGSVLVTKDEVGSFDVGYKRFRIFYDGIGGFFPLNNRWMELANPELHTDRAKFWAEAKIERPNMPKFEFRYTNETRTGKKDSTIWGDTDFTGVPSYYGVGASALNPYSTNRKIVPAYIDMDERQQNWFGAVKHSVGNTDLEFEVVHDIASANNLRTVNRYPGELQLYPRQSSSTNPPKVYPPETISNEVFGWDIQYFDSTITSYTGKFETKVTDRASVYGGVLYSEGSADIGGDRQMIQYMPTAVGVVKAVGGFVGASGWPPYSYKTADGEVNEKILAANVGVKYRPQDALYTSLALKYEKKDIDGYNTTVYTSTRIDQVTGATTPIVNSTPNLAERTEKTWIPEAEVRYTGIKDVTFYGTFDYRHSPGDEYGNSTGVTTGGGVRSPTISYDNVKLNHAHYKAGANWKVNAITTLRCEFFYKDHKNGFYGYNTSAGDSFVLGYEFFGTKVSAIVKALDNLTFTTRLLNQDGKMDVTIDGGTSMRSNDTQNVSIAETVDWSPTAQTFVQANLNVVYNTIQTSYPVAGGLGNDVMRNADNNYVSGSLITGFVVDKATDVSVQYTYYRADNFKFPTYAAQFYGAGAKEYTAALVVKHKFTDRVIGECKVGYFNSKNETTGGNTNFKGPMAYLSLTQAL